MHTITKGICPKVNEIARLKFELVSYDYPVHRFNHYAMRTLVPGFVMFCFALQLYDVKFSDTMEIICNYMSKSVSIWYKQYANIFIWPIDRMLVQRGPGSNGNESQLHNPQIFGTGAHYQVHFSATTKTPLLAGDTVNEFYPPADRFGLVWFLCLMPYQPLQVI